MQKVASKTLCLLFVDIAEYFTSVELKEIAEEAIFSQ